MSGTLSEASTDNKLPPLPESVAPRFNQLIEKRQFLRLVWREWRILWWWAIVSIGLTWGLMSLLAFLLSREPPTPATLPTMLVVFYCLTLVAPFTFLFGAIASSFSSECDEPGFHWCTTMPVPWMVALASKLLSSLLGTVTCWLLALVLADLMSKPYEVVPSSRATLLGPLFETVFPSCFGLAFAIYSISVTCVQLGRRSATGFSLAICLPAPAVLAWIAGLHHFSISNQAEVLWFLVYCGPWLTGGVFLLIAAGLYRWRWYVGMYSKLMPASLWSVATSPVRNRAAAWPAAWRPPNQLFALFWLAWKKGRLAWWGVALAGVAIALGTIVQEEPDNPLLLLPTIGYFVLGLFIGLGSIWSFYGERAGEPECFLAERGVSPSTIWWSRYLAICVGGSILLFGVLDVLGVVASIFRASSLSSSANYDPFQFGLLVFLGIHVFCVGCLLAGQTFRTWQFALFAIVGASFVLPIILSTGGRAGDYRGVKIYLVFGLALIPLSWWLCRYASIRWQPNLDWVCPVLAVTIFLAILITNFWGRS